MAEAVSSPKRSPTFQSHLCTCTMRSSHGQAMKEFVDNRLQFCSTNQLQFCSFGEPRPEARPSVELCRRATGLAGWVGIGATGLGRRRARAAISERVHVAGELLHPRFRHCAGSVAHPPCTSSASTARYLLDLLLGNADRQVIPGDMQEEFAAKLAKYGPRGARVWFWAETVRVIATRNPICRWILVAGLMRFGNWIMRMMGS